MNVHAVMLGRLAAYAVSASTSVLFVTFGTQPGVGSSGSRQVFYEGGRENG